MEYGVAKWQKISERFQKFWRGFGNFQKFSTLLQPYYNIYKYTLHLICNLKTSVFIFCVDICINKWLIAALENYTSNNNIPDAS